MSSFAFLRPIFTRSAAAALIGVTLLAAPARAQRFHWSPNDRTTLDTTVAFSKGGVVTLNARQGDIIVTGSARNEVHIHATSEGDNIRFDATSSHVTLELSLARGGSDSRFEVTVPYGARVEARNQSGDVSVRGTKGEVEAHTLSGDIRVEDVVGRLDVNTLSGGLEASGVAANVSVSTVNGDPRLSDVKGDVEIGTVSGDITLRGVTSKSVRVKTTSGDIGYDGIIDPTGRYELVTHSGDITLDIPRDVSAQLTLRTWSGSIDSDFPITLKPGEQGIGSTNSKNLTFEIGAGAARISAETFSGDITIKSGGRGAR